jgi:pyrroloquinoline quinone biosynthesis protein B
MGRLTAIVLGSAAGGGFPQWNCRCPVCRLAWAGDARVRARTQAGLAVSADGDVWVLLNASPDLSQQIRQCMQLHPRSGTRGSPIGAVVLTGTEVDQIAGLLALRERQSFSLFATASSLATLAENPIFGVLAGEMVTRRAVVPGQQFELPGGLAAELFLVPGKVPLYLESDNPDTSAETVANAGIELSAGSTRIAYIPGAAAITPRMLDYIRRADVVFFDGTLFRDDEMLATGTGEKSGRRMGHVPIDATDGPLALLNGVRARRILVHINNTNPILIDGSPERTRVEASGWEVAEDGMEIVL